MASSWMGLGNTNAQTAKYKCFKEKEEKEDRASGSPAYPHPLVWRLAGKRSWVLHDMKADTRHHNLR